MKCQICGQREASIHYVEVADGKKTHQWICSECASKDGIAGTPGAVAHGNLEAFLGGMSEHFEELAESGREATQQVCDVCGYTLQQMQETGLLGCADCYASFREQIQPILRRFHREISHVGKAPQGHGEQAELRQQVAIMRVALARAVSREDYEEAARLRDTIEKIKQSADVKKTGESPADQADAPSAEDPEAEA